MDSRFGIRNIAYFKHKLLRSCGVNGTNWKLFKFDCYLEVVNQQIFCRRTGTDRIRVESKGINHTDGWGRSRISGYNRHSPSIYCYPMNRIIDYDYLLTFLYEMYYSNVGVPCFYMSENQLLVSVMSVFS